MAKISELSGEAREKRIAELKAKMQAAAEKAKAAQGAGESPAAAAPAPAAPEPATPTAPAAASEAQAESVATDEAEPEAEAAPKAAPRPRPAREAAPTNGAAAAKPAPRPAPKPQPRVNAADAAPSPQEMTRREFMTYAWGAALGLLALEGGVVSFMFMYPRFRAGEFGGEFLLSANELPAPDAPPVANSAGKFWLVTTEEGDPRALYMVCTHLGCLYKWEESNGRFECPCHGSKFTHDGYYIEGPAPRSLDQFEISIVDGEIVVDTGARVNGDPSTESPARAAA